jgi:4-amino-4-deoxy-L-arabinose transferase-like glycosyltransferase
MSGDKLWKPFRRGDLFAVFALAVILRLAVFAASNDQIGTQKVLDDCFDCRLYLNMANAITAGTPGNYENGFFYFGPGYAYWLALNNLLFHGHPIPIIIVNILVSALSCVLIYLFAMVLVRSYPVALIAACLAAVSYTSIMLSCLLMSDTVYFFIFTSGLIIYLKALTDGGWSKFALAGVLAGAAILTRSVGQFWPMMMIVIAAVYAYKRPGMAFPHSFRRKELVARVAVAVAIPLVITTVWMFRNYKTHDVFAMGITSANGPGNLAAVTLERMTGRPAPEIMKDWIDYYMNVNGKSEVTLGETFKIYASRGRWAIDTLKWETFKTYRMLVWDNLNRISYLHRQLLPAANEVTIPLEMKLMESPIHYLNFALSMIGFILLLYTRKFRVAGVLATIFLYYAAMLGFYRWQYSRHFFPGQIACAVLIAYTIVWLWSTITRRRDSAG